LSRGQHERNCSQCRADGSNRAASVERAGLGTNDIDCFEVQDTDAFCEIEIYEELGLCELGAGGRLIEAGHTAIDGPQPVNMSGGLISKGEPVGASHLGQVVEIVAQLRGACGPRQVADAKTGLATCSVRVAVVR
jgi:acetyl-CoA acetyltransferase